MDLKKHLTLYLVFGVLTTLVNIAVYLFLTKICGVNYLIANVAAWVLSVLFAYVTNRRWVFESRSSNIAKEITLFFSGRLFSGIVDMVLMFLFIDVLFIDDFISKLLIQVIVVVLNYIISKDVVFKK